MSQRHPHLWRLAFGAVVSLAACNSSSTTPPVASSVVVLNGNTISGTAGTALAAPIVVQVLDQNGVAMAGVNVTFTPSPLSGVVSSPTMVTDGNGTASVTWTLGTVVGTDTMAIDVSGVSNTSITASVGAGDPATLVIVGGAAQDAAAGTTLSVPLSVQVSDQFGNPTPNVTVAWSDDANGTFAASTEVTNQSGVAQNTYTLGPNPGVEDIGVTVATASGPLTTSFTETGS